MESRRRKMTRKWPLLLLAAVWIAGAVSTAPAAEMLDPYASGTVDTADYVQKAQGYIVVFDASQTMWYRYMERQKLELAKRFVWAVNETLPREADLDGALRTFGGAEAYGAPSTSLAWGPAPHTKSALANAVSGLGPASGLTPLATALEAAYEELGRMEGTVALIVVSDGKETDEGPVAAARMLKETYGDRLCIWPVLVGDSAEGRETMQGLADAGGCGFFAEASDLTSPVAMGDWVRSVFYTQKEEPMTEEVSTGAVKAMDGDGDGVADALDKCPDTPRGAPVDRDGCWVLENVLFDFDESHVRTAHYAMLIDIAKVMTLNPGLRIRVSGHTDWIGTEAYNQGLSRRRAESVKTFLVERGAPAERILLEWFGESRPTASNTAPAGRQLNRRATFQRIR